jgi:hypothetical protein
MSFITITLSHTLHSFQVFINIKIHVSTKINHQVHWTVLELLNMPMHIMVNI